MINRNAFPWPRAIACTTAFLLFLGASACGGPETPVSTTSASQTTAAGISTTAGTTGEAAPTDTSGTTGSASKGNGLRPNQTTATGRQTTATKEPVPATPSTPKYDFLANFPPELKGKTIRLLYWAAPTSTLKQQAADFKAKTGVNVTFIQTTWELYLSRLVTLNASKSSPDIGVITQDFWPSAIIKNLYEEISVGAFDLKNDPAYDLDAMKISSWNGKNYGVALKNSVGSTTMNVLLYNKTLFKKNNRPTPFELWKQGKWNWDTYLDAAKFFTKTVNKVQYYGTAVLPETYMLSANTDFVKFSTSGNKTSIKNNLSDPALEKAWRFYVETRDVYKVEPKSTTANDFYTGKIAMKEYIDARDANSLNINEIRKAMKDEVGVAPFPCPAGQQRVAPAKSLIWGIPAGAKNPVAASYFIRYFLDSNTLSDKDVYINDEAKAVYADLVNVPKNALMSRGVVGYNTMSDFWSMFTDVAYGDVAQVKGNLAKWSNKLDSSIKEIEKEMLVYS